MKYSVAFKGLPSEPEKRQVIYVENLYDKRINALIKDNYQQIKWILERTSLDFIYLPMFFDDEETKEKVLYYAPYLTSEIIEKAELRSSYLLRYMSHQENREKITPSLLYSPKKDNKDWIFQGQTFDIDGGEVKEVRLSNGLKIQQKKLKKSYPKKNRIGFVFTFVTMKMKTIESFIAAMKIE